MQPRVADHTFALHSQQSDLLRSSHSQNVCSQGCSVLVDIPEAHWDPGTLNACPTHAAEGVKGPSENLQPGVVPLLDAERGVLCQSPAAWGSGSGCCCKDHRGPCSGISKYKCKIPPVGSTGLLHHVIWFNIKYLQAVAGHEFIVSQLSSLIGLSCKISCI